MNTNDDGAEARAFLLLWLDKDQSELLKVRATPNRARTLEAVRHLRRAIEAGRLASAEDWDSLLQWIGAHASRASVAGALAAQHKRPGRESVKYWQQVRELDNPKLKPEQIIPKVEAKLGKLTVSPSSFVRTVYDKRRKEWASDASR